MAGWWYNGKFNNDNSGEYHVEEETEILTIFDFTQLWFCNFAPHALALALFACLIFVIHMCSVGRYIEKVSLYCLLLATAMKSVTVT